ncbi:MAG: phosphoglycerate kinase [Rhizobiales bacterium]|nr:phosphoglycerate kinase [Hyphomicrobiales bacterium]
MDLGALKPATSADVRGKRVLVRADLNVPVNGGKVSDATRIERFVPTVRDLAARGARVVVISHFGRPKGADPTLTLAPVAAALAERLPGIAVTFTPHVIGDGAADAVAALGDGEVVVLENVRFDPREEKNEAAFTAALAALGDVYVNDAFSCAHRAHASTEGLAHHLPAYAGGQMMAEIEALRTALEQPRRPVAALVGGAKVSTKIPVLTHLVAKVDVLIIGGGMANTFLLANGHPVGKSLCEPDLVATAREVREAAKAAGCEIVLPVDVVAADGFAANAPHAIYGVETVPADRMILDVGPATTALLAARLASCATLLWNGPLGAFELTPFDAGTMQLARAAADLTDAGRLTTVAGGGDTVAALNVAGVTDRFTYVSTAGGAFLEWLEGRELPGVAALAR